MANQNILQRAQVKGTTQTIASYAGLDGQLVVNKTTGDLHVMTGVAGSNKVLPCRETVSQMIKSEAPAPDLSGYLTKNDASSIYLGKQGARNTYLSKTDASDNYLGKTAKAQSAKVADSANSVLGSNVNGAVSQATHASSASSASSADSAKSVAWNNVSGKPAIPSMWSYGTEDLTAGSSSLETGKLHFVYE